MWDEMYSSLVAVNYENTIHLAAIRIDTKHWSTSHAVFSAGPWSLWVMQIYIQALQISCKYMQRCFNYLTVACQIVEKKESWLPYFVLFDFCYWACAPVIFGTCVFWWQSFLWPFFTIFLPLFISDVQFVSLKDARIHSPACISGWAVKGRMDGDRAPTFQRQRLL